MKNQTYMNLQNKKIRHEFKYILKEKDARAIEIYLNKLGIKKDSAQEGEYPVTSLYFDTPILEDYRDKLSGLKHRKKLRARIHAYNFDNKNHSVWLETKEKHDMNIFKKRAMISNDEWNMFSDDLYFKVNKISKTDNKLKRFSYLFLRKNYKPHIVVRYFRKAYVGNFISDFRVTFDSNIEACNWVNFKYNNMVPISRGNVVLEVKFYGAMCWWFKDMVNRFNLSRSAFSKYTNSIDVLKSYNPVAR